MAFRHRNNERLTSEIWFYACCTLRVFAALWVTKYKKKKKREGGDGEQETQQSFTTETCPLQEVPVPTDAKWKTHSFKQRRHPDAQGGLGLSKVILSTFPYLWHGGSMGDTAVTTYKKHYQAGWEDGGQEDCHVTFWGSENTSAQPQGLLGLLSNTAVTSVITDPSVVRTTESALSF